MSERRKWLGLIIPLIAALLCGAGCKESSPATSHPSTQSTVSIQDSGVPGERTLQPLQERVFQLGGEVDVANRYLSAVMVTTSFGEEKRSRCSGVLVSPLLVLTAGHCVCMPRQATSPEDGGKSLIDSSACAATATVKTVKYETPKVGAEEADVASKMEVFHGRIRSHPNLRVILDAHGSVASSQADLAVVILDEPVKEAPLSAPLADTGVQVGDSIIVVGYGYDELADGYDGERRASRNRIIQAPTSADPRAVFEQPGGHPYKGDSGGPCLREGLKGPELVGISSRSLGKGATLTSLHPYRDWLRAQSP